MKLLIKPVAFILTLICCYLFVMFQCLKTLGSSLVSFLPNFPSFSLWPQREADPEDFSRSLRMEGLEARALLAADLGNAVAETIDAPEVDIIQQAEDFDSVKVAEDTISSEQNSLTQASSLELILIDEGVENSDQMVAEIVAQRGQDNVMIEKLPAGADGVESITKLLESLGHEFDAIHIISHGEAGFVNLGGTELSLDSVGAFENELASWANSLTEDADLMFYGCNLAETAEGQKLLMELSELTTADVAASIDLTGSAELGGDWELEFNDGEIEAVELAFSSWKGTLSSLPTFSADPALYQVYSKFGRVGQVDFDNGGFDEFANSLNQKVNAAGFRSADNYAYGILSQTKELARIGGDGSFENLGSVTGLPTDEGSMYVGDFASDDLLYVRTNSARDKLYGINVVTGTVDNIITTSHWLPNIYDIAFNPNDSKFYTSQRGVENQLLSIGLDGTVATIGGNGIGKLTFGAMYADNSGGVFGAANQTGGIYKFDTTTGEATQIGRGPISGVNDGFSNASTVMEFVPYAANDEITKDSISVTNGDLFADNGNGTDLDGDGDTISITAVEGNPASVGNTVQLASGAEVTVNSDGTFAYNPNGKYTDLVVGQTITDSFQYTLTDSDGNESVANVVMSMEGVMEAGGVDGHVMGLEVYGVTNPSITDAGDINGDGFNDGIVGAEEFDNGTGAAFLVYGDASGIPQNFNVNTLLAENGGDGSQGTVFVGINEDDLAGSAVAAAGDINGDGIDDLIIGARDADPDGDNANPNGTKNAGEAFVVFGSATGYDAEFQLGDLKSSGGGDGSEGFVINGISAHDGLGREVGGVGDVNDDGIDDLAVSAKHADVDASRKNAGQAYVIFGDDNGFSAEIDAEDLLAANGGNGTEGFVINGTRKHDLLGTDISGGADVNGDGIDDMIVTSRLADANGMIDSGQSYVIYGSGSHSAEMEVSSLLEANGGDGTEGVVFNGSERNTKNGSYVQIVADVDSDGKAELATGVNDRSGGDQYLVYGSNQLGAEIDLISLKDTSVYLDNFDQGDPNYDDRSWDKYTANVSMHSNEGTRVTIWGDPHVVTYVDGVLSMFDIGYGAGSITVSGGVTFSWDTDPYDVNNPDRLLPLLYFTVDTVGTDNDKTVWTNDGQDLVDFPTDVTDTQLREFIEELSLYAGAFDQPLQKS